MPIPRLRDYRSCAFFVRLPAVLLLRGGLHRRDHPGLAAGVLRADRALKAFTPRDWHVHEMLFGYISAVVAGFLLTAVPNWTGRLPLQGRPLAILFSVWVAGRIAVSSSAWLGWAPAMASTPLFSCCWPRPRRAKSSRQEMGQLQCRHHRQPARCGQSGVPYRGALFRVWPNTPRAPASQW